MSATVTLTITTGKFRGKDFTFARPGKRLIGRAEGCDVRFPSDGEHLTISRLHCLLDVAPTGVRLWDFDSRNGTHVNGERVTPCDWPPPAGEKNRGGRPLADGDEIRVGDVVLRVHIEPVGEAEHTEECCRGEPPCAAQAPPMPSTS
jgi:pSer/pThr/pTyr-binding forkhead associated (FHA) protein